ncbi:MAG TPA: DUF2892 domain-containing protein [Nitrospiraceae bacterium]|jgi:hypothetical protein|nr:DUF2892 domain-containing protein [Nitrospiraceae bacterium]
MTSNLGGIERSIRIVLGIILMAVGYFTAIPEGAAIAAYLVGAIALVTGVAGFCPAWKLFGLNTCRTKESARS